MKKRNFVLTGIALGLSVFATSLSAQAAIPNEIVEQGSLAPMLEKAQAAVVTLSVEGKAKANSRSALPDDIPEEFKFFFGDQFGEQFGGNRGSSRNFRGLGSGVIINADKGYVLTNNHVVDGADKITVKLQDGREFNAKLVGKDEQSDIALVQIEKPTNLTAIKIADSDKLRVGDFTVAIGNPFGLGQTVTSGEVRRGLLGIKGGELNADLAKAFNVSAQQGAFVSEVIPNSAAEKAGLKAGDVITAMNGQKISSFAEMRAKIATSGAGKEIELTYLRDGKTDNVKVTLQADDGSQTASKTELPALDGATLNNYDAKGVKGVEISKVQPNSMAAQRGLKSGDIIIGINRQPIESTQDLRKALDEKPSAVALNILRGKNNFYLLVQ